MGGWFCLSVCCFLKLLDDYFIHVGDFVGVVVDAVVVLLRACSSYCFIYVHGVFFVCFVFLVCVDGI